MTSYFISDLHLESAKPAMTAGFLAFLKQLKPADRLYILGDFFEVWMGDDYQDALTETVITALRQLTEQGSQLFLMHGNRDFLIGDAFCQQTGAELLPDPCVIELQGVPVLLMHGDSLCTRDTEYMKLRQMLRNPQWQQQFLSQSLEQRIAFARQVRSESQSDQQMKSDDIMDVTAQEVDQVMSEHQVSWLIHGHTHRPQIHYWEHQGQPRERWVLGDWDEQHGWSIDDASGQCELRRFAFDSL
ncbi:UDP-2,3-diacylglucosamine diphosphatase [Bacterioplanes sanyensis]|uniref:UDP-2,3-diacylglucosamine hydrolase n=1 Tax=Bacterioplanes sanyensis TaxID=1249553 RepID=A0A222FLS3_9GAMM|nr:UDP-2,3-diacylglucosamine diphosphatase [Bacterioplanes sanyensis]ASP39977.1 UDP-2,3-diacylglucosamine diphosphatase [Bacterioplanes sanyensis]